MNAESPGPQPGDRVLLISHEQTHGTLDLARLVFENDKVYLNVVHTAAEAIGKLSEPFDLVWIQLPLPDLQAPLLCELLLAEPNLADRVGAEDMFQAMVRLSKMPVLQSLEPLAKKRDVWIWVRLRTADEREWMQRLLERCARK